jgi:hypothetical protein
MSAFVSSSGRRPKAEAPDRARYFCSSELIARALAGASIIEDDPNPPYRFGSVAEGLGLTVRRFRGTADKAIQARGIEPDGYGWAKLIEDVLAKDHPELVG